MKKLSFVCPFCFEKVKISDIQYRCSNGRCEGREEEDPEFTAYLNGGQTGAGIPLQRLGHVIEAQKQSFSLGVPKPVMCDKCGHPTLRICPKCHNTLPDSTIMGADNIISIIGTRSSGKSLYIGVLINELQNRIAPALDASMSGFVDMSGQYNADKIYRMTKYTTLYEAQEVLPQTQGQEMGMLADSNQDKRPLVYRFAYIKDKLGRKDDFTLAFFDAAGEDQEDPQMAATVMRYIAHSKGIIFLLDPLQIADVLDRVEASSGEKSYSTGTGGGSGSIPPNVVLANLTTLIRQSLGIEGKRKKIGIPVAIAFSKFDAIQPIVPRELTLQQPSPHCSAGAFVASDAQNIDNEMRSLLQSWNQQSVIAAMETDYKCFSFFSVSSLGLGNAPDSGMRIKRPHPHRVEDPLLWVMQKNSLISTLRQ